MIVGVLARLSGHRNSLTDPPALAVANANAPQQWFRSAVLHHGLPIGDVYAHCGAEAHVRA